MTITYIEPTRSGPAARRRRRRAWLLSTVAWTLATATAPALALNDCLPAHFIDLRGLASIEIANDDPTNPFRYRPRCVTVSEGTRVLFRALPNFGMHPLFGGTVVKGQASIDPTSPIGTITSGSQAERLLVGPGEWPYFCDVHFDQGMMGSIQVVPELFADGFELAPAAATKPSVD